MKTLVKIIVLVACVLGTTFVVSSSCKKKNTTAKSEVINQALEEDLRIDIAQQFAGEKVIVELDGNEIFADTVSTWKTLGVAHLLHVNSLLVGTHEISVNVDGVEAKREFNHEKDRIAFVYYNPITSEISFTFGHGPLLYE